jgi:5-methylcytosine-specific restriction endonuclease McrA
MPAGRPKEGFYRVCQVCGESFYKPPSHQAKWPNRTCSRKCAGVLRERRIEKNCEQCGKPFSARIPRVEKGYDRFCSNACQGLSERGIMYKPRPSLFSDKQRRMWLGTECIRCGSTEFLELDHIIPRFAGGKPTKDNAQTLCRTCNKLKHWEEDRPKYHSVIRITLDQ